MARPSPPAVVRIGEGAGYAGARLEPAVRLAEAGRLDYLSFECLAERTIALAQLARRADPAGGYDPLLERRLDAVLPACRAAGTRLLTSMGAANPAAAGAAALALARRRGWQGLRVGVVTGDDVLATVLAEVDRLTLLESGRPLAAIRDRVVSANAYLGSGPLVEALDAGADVVIAGRVADPALHLAALRHAFGWAADDWPRLGAGTAVGHLLECGPQVTGGYHADPGRLDVPDLAALGTPIAECRADGTAVITKLPGSGGRVDRAVCTEQLLYELGDPAAYVTPDVVADFSGVRLEPDGPDRVRVGGASGRPAPPTLKVTVGYLDGWIGEGQISYGGTGCVRRARLAGEVVRRRLADAGTALLETRVDLIGLDSLRLPGAADRPEPAEVRLRVAGRAADRATAEAVGREVEGLWITGPYGGDGATRAVREVVAVESVFLPRDRVATAVVVEEA
jgi:hypothetical protein